jgi:hypothetical protein
MATNYVYQIAIKWTKWIYDIPTNTFHNLPKSGFFVWKSGNPVNSFHVNTRLTLSEVLQSEPEPSDGPGVDFTKSFQPKFYGYIVPYLKKNFKLVHT